jgi:hypothetical protein
MFWFMDRAESKLYEVTKETVLKQQSLVLQAKRELKKSQDRKD